MDPATAFYIATAAMAAGTAVTAIDKRNANIRREHILQQELRSAELAALDEENRRLQDLRYANSDMLANAGGIDAWASPSLLAARAFNFKMGMEDIQNTRYNVASERAGISARIAILKANSRAVITAGIFEIAGIGFGGYAKGSQLKKTIPTDGSGGINAELGVGILDTPGKGGTGNLA